jgi:predicted enzyme related to lactoylglutathione lyase
MAHVAVPDVAAAADRAKELGGSVMHAPTDIPGAGCFAVLADPQGAVFALHSTAT